MTGRSPRVIQRALRELKAAGLISVQQSNGRTPLYRLSTPIPETSTSRGGETSTSPGGRRPRLGGGDAHVSGGETPTSPEVVIEVVTEEIREAAAAAASPSIPTQEAKQDEKTRQTCPTCLKSWPARFGTICYHCPQPTASQIRRREQRERDRISETEDPPVPIPMKPEKRQQLEAEAYENGYRKRTDGQWARWYGGGTG